MHSCMLSTPAVYCGEKRGVLGTERAGKRMEDEVVKAWKMFTQNQSQENLFHCHFYCDSKSSVKH